MALWPTYCHIILILCDQSFAPSPERDLTITAQSPVSVTLDGLQLDAHSALQVGCVSPSGFPIHNEQITSEDWWGSVSLSSLVFS